MTNLISHGRTLSISEPTGSSVLPLVEVDKDKVLKKYGRITLPKQECVTADSSYGQFDTPTLSFSAWELFHAAKKTELTRAFSSQRADDLALLFAHEHHDRFVWNTDNLRCADGSGLWLEDFSGKGLAGRIGEAIAYLSMTKLWGYTYWDRAASVWMRAASKSHINHRDMVKVARFTGNLTSGQFELQPDFIFEKASQEVALMEAKGSFVTPGNDRPDAKGPLRHGLDQTAKWASLIRPAPSKCIAVSSLLREQSDASNDPSLILHVDPPPGESLGIEPAEIPRDAIRRANIGAWLTGMGFQASGTALTIGRESGGADARLPVVTISGLDFAIRIHGWRMSQDQRELAPFFPFELWDLFPRHLDLLHEVGIAGVYVYGIELKTLLATCSALREPSSSAMLDLPRIGPGVTSDSHGRDGFYGSIFPDGSMLGVISSRHFERTTRRVETFALC